MTRKVRALSLFACIASAFAAGAFAGAEWLPETELVLDASDSAKVFGALAILSASHVPPKNIACEIMGPEKTVNGETVYPDVTVGNYLSQFLLSTFSNNRLAFRSFRCGGDTSRTCELAFGNRSRGGLGEGGSRILRFTYNSRTNAVAADSVECIDVP